jgi:hypothetical protein
MVCVRSAAEATRAFAEPPPTDAELMEGNLGYLREKYAIGFITLEELEIGLDSVLRGGAINVPRGEGKAP